MLLRWHLAPTFAEDHYAPHQSSARVPAKALQPHPFSREDLMWRAIKRFRRDSSSYCYSKVHMLSHYARVYMKKIVRYQKTFTCCLDVEVRVFFLAHSACIPEQMEC